MWQALARFLICVFFSVDPGSDTAEAGNLRQHECFAFPIVGVPRTFVSRFQLACL